MRKSPPQAEAGMIKKIKVQSSELKIKMQEL